MSGDRGLPCSRRDLLRQGALAAAAGLAGGCVGITRDSSAPVDLLRPGAWAVHRPMPSGRQEVAVAALADRVVVLGGLGELGAPVATAEAYRPASDAWEPLTPLPAPVHHAAAAVVGGRLFVIGGYTDRLPPQHGQRTVYEYDAARNSWATRAPLLIGRGAHAAAVLGGRIHVVGGADGDPLGEHEAYDPAGDRWTRAAPLPVAREHLAAVALGERLWAIGGRAGFLGAQHAHVDLYDPARDRWEAGPALPEGRGGLAAAVIDDRLFVLGGEAPLRVFSANEMYDATRREWIGKEPMPTPRHGTGAAVVDGRIWIAGGGTRPGLARTSANEAYRP